MCVSTYQFMVVHLIQNFKCAVFCSLSLLCCRCAAADVMHWRGTAPDRRGRCAARVTLVCLPPPSTQKKRNLRDFKAKWRQFRRGNDERRCQVRWKHEDASRRRSEVGVNFCCSWMCAVIHCCQVMSQRCASVTNRSD